MLLSYLARHIVFMNLCDMTWLDVKRLAPDTPLLFPMAAVEQHGPHLPLYTDSYLLGEVVRRAVEHVGERVLVAPLQWLGNSDHHLDFAGTLSAAPRAYLDLLAGLAENAIQHGFRRIVFVNGHGGNDIPGKQALFEVRQRFRNRTDLLLLFATYWTLAEPQKTIADLVQDCMGHACEWETSMMLRLGVGCVGPLEGLEPVPFGHPFEPASRAWITRERSEPGYIGDPRQATAEKGEALFREFGSGLVELLERVLAWDGRSWNG